MSKSAERDLSSNDNQAALENQSGAVDRPTVGFALAIAVLTIAAIGFATGAFQGEVDDTDTFSWFNRVIGLWENRTWFDDTILRVEPGGSDQHWGRPYDLVLLVVAALLSPFLSIHDALVVWVAVLPIVLASLTVIAIWRFFGDLYDRNGLVALAVIVPLQGGFIAAFQPGRGDHHGMILLLTVLLLGGGGRLVSEPSPSVHSAVKLGLLAGIALWTSIELILAVMVILMVVGVRWVMGSIPLSSLRGFLTGLTLATAFAIAAARATSGFTSVLFDELSIIHVVGFGIATAATIVVAQIPGDSVSRRLVIGAALGAASLALMFVLFPELGDRPFVKIEPTYQRVRLGNLAEGQLVFSGSLADSIANFAVVIAPLPLGIFGLVQVVRRRVYRRAPAWLLIATAGVLHTWLTLTVALRWGITASLVLALAGAYGAQEVLRLLSPRVRHAAIQSVIVFGLAVWWVPALLAVSDASQVAERCESADLIALLDESSVPPGGLLLAWSDFGPHVLFDTEYSVMSIPNHRLQEGFVPSYTVLHSASDAEQRKVVDEFGVDLIAICTSEGESGLFEDEPGSLHEDLRLGQIPPWLRSIGADPSRELDSEPVVLLFEVDHGMLVG